MKVARYVIQLLLATLLPLAVVVLIYFATPYRVGAASFLSVRLAPLVPLFAVLALPRLRGWRGGVFFGLLGAHFTLAVVRLVMFLGVPASVVPGVLLAPVAFIQNMMLVNVYAPFGVMIDRREQIEFEGSDDGGRTWKRYPYRHTFADPARMPSVVSPYMPRFEGMMFLLGRFAGTQRNDAVVTTGALLTEGAPDVTRLFESNPFPDRPPDQMRFVLYRIEFNSLEQKQATGHYWERTYVSEYLPGLQRDPETQLLRQLPPVR